MNPVRSPTARARCQSIDGPPAFVGAQSCRSGEMAARQGARTGLGCRLLGPLGLSTFDKSSGHPLVGAFPLCARSATAYANSLIGNQAQPRLDRPWHTAPRRGSGFRPTILIARAAERPRHGNQGGWGGGVFPRGYGHEHHERTWFLPCDRSSRRRRTEICLPDVRVGICLALDSQSAPDRAPRRRLTRRQPRPRR